MKGTKILATLMLSALLITGCGMKDQKAVIKINDTVITQKQHDELMKKQLAQSPFAKCQMQICQAIKTVLYIL